MMLCIIFPMILSLLIKHCRVKNRRLSMMTIRPGYLSLETTSFNEAIFKFGNNRYQSLPTSKDSSSQTSLFYNIGVFSSVLCSILGFFLLSRNLFLHATLFFESSSPDSTTTATRPTNMLVPLIPGITIPMTFAYIIPLSVSILISAGFHELGHAIASAREGVRIQSIGMFLVAPFLCGAYVRLPHQFQGLAPRKKLRVWSAGIWHNILLCLILFVMTSSPMMWIFRFVSIPLYSTGNGAVMLESFSISPLHGYVEASDVLVGLGGHSIRSVSDWYDSIRDLSSSASSRRDGFCVDKEWTSERSSLTTCCEFQEEEDPDVMCFQHLRSGSSSDGKEIAADKKSESKNLFCGSVSSLARVSKELCSSSSQCSDSNQECVAPVQLDINERIVWIDVRRQEGISRSIYVGDMNSLWSGIQLSDREFRYAQSTFFTLLPMCLERTLNLALGISATLAVVNSIPMYYLDGQHIFDCILNIILLRRRKGRRTRKRKWDWKESRFADFVYLWFMRGGTLLLGLNVFISVAIFLHPIMLKMMGVFSSGGVDEEDVPLM